MNMSTFLNDIKLKEGLNNIALPWKEPVEVVLQRSLQASVRTYSHFKPYEKECYTDKNALKSPDDYSKKLDIYYIPPELTSTPVHDCYGYIVSNTPLATNTSVNAFTVGSPFVGFGSYMPQDILDATTTGAAINKYAGITSQPSICKWLGANKVHLFNVPPKATLRFVAKCDHDLNGETIEESCVESFKLLATYDIQEALYNNLLPYQEVGAVHKSIQMKIDRWAGAAEKREALLNEWTGSFHLDEIENLVQFF